MSGTAIIAGIVVFVLALAFVGAKKLIGRPTGSLLRPIAAGEVQIAFVPIVGQEVIFFSPRGRNPRRATVVDFRCGTPVLTVNGLTRFRRDMSLLRPRA